MSILAITPETNKDALANATEQAPSAPTVIPVTPGALANTTMTPSASTIAPVPTLASAPTPMPTPDPIPIPVPSPPPSDKIPILHLIGYFLLGLFFNIIGFIFGGLWIWQKARSGKKVKVLMLLFGIGAGLIIGLLAQKGLVSTVPSMGYIPEILSDEYPKVNMGVSKIWGAGGTEQSTLSVSIPITTPFSAEKRKELGIKVCAALERNGDNYDVVEILQTKKKYFIIDLSSVEGRSCDDWTSQPPMEIMFPDW